MKCYYHPQVDAVALCKSCHRALCIDCSSDVPPGTACKSRCEQDVLTLNETMERNRGVYLKTGRAYKRVAIIFLVMGLVFAFLGLLPILILDDYGTAFLAIFGVIFIFASLLTFVSSREIQNTPKKH